MAYVTEKRGVYYAVIYQGRNPVTGRERRRWHRCEDRIDAERVAEALTAKHEPRRDRVGSRQRRHPGAVPTRPGSSRCSGTSRSSNPTSSSSRTSTCCAPSSPSNASTTTPSGSTPASATSPPTKNTEAKEKPSEPPAGPASPEPAPPASPTIAPTEPEDPPMRTETPGNSDIKSDTGQPAEHCIGETAASRVSNRRGGPRAKRWPVPRRSGEGHPQGRGRSRQGFARRTPR